MFLGCITLPLNLVLPWCLMRMACGVPSTAAVGLTTVPPRSYWRCYKRSWSTRTYHRRRGLSNTLPSLPELCNFRLEVRDGSMRVSPRFRAHTANTGVSARLATFPVQKNLLQASKNLSELHCIWVWESNKCSQVEEFSTGTTLIIIVFKNLTEHAEDDFEPNFGLMFDMVWHW